MENLGDRIFESMKRQGYRPQQLADKLEVSKQYLYDIKSGRIKNPAYTFLMKFRDIGINPDWIMTGEGEPFLEGYVEPVKKSMTSEINDRIFEELRLLRAQLQKKDEQIDKLLNILGKPNVSQSIPPVRKFNFPSRAVYFANSLANTAAPVGL